MSRRAGERGRGLCDRTQAPFRPRLLPSVTVLTPVTHLIYRGREDNRATRKLRTITGVCVCVCVTERMRTLLKIYVLDVNPEG